MYCYLTRVGALKCFLVYTSVHMDPCAGRGRIAEVIFNSPVNPYSAGG